MSKVLNAAVSLVVVGSVPPDQLAWLVQEPEALPPEFLIQLNVAADNGTPDSNSELSPAKAARLARSNLMQKRRGAILAGLGETVFNFTSQFKSAGAPSSRHAADWPSAAQSAGSLRVWRNFQPENHWSANTTWCVAGSIANFLPGGAAGRHLPRRVGKLVNSFKSAG